MGEELNNNVKFAKLLSEKYKVKLLPVTFIPGRKYPDMIINDKTIVEYKEISTTSISNVKRNIIKKAVKQFRDSIYKNKSFVIAIQVDNINKIYLQERLKKRRPSGESLEAVRVFALT